MSNPKVTLARSQATQLIRRSSGIYLATHIRPDGDALGSLLGLALALEAEGHRVARLCAYPVPDYYRFLPGADLVTTVRPEWPADLGIVVDCDGLRRVGSLIDTFSGLPHLIDIDHHATEQTFGEVRVIEPEAAATAEIVYAWLREMGSAVTAEIATCLYTAILTDTGRFSFSNTTPRSFAIASDLILGGADPSAIAAHVYFQRSFAYARLLGVALSRVTLHLEGQVISTVLHQEDFAETGSTSEDTEGIIDQVRTVGGPVVAALLTESEPGETRVSLRSNGDPDVSQVALHFGGGGHAAAAGCTVPARPEEAQGLVLAEVARLLRGREAERGA